MKGKAAVYILSAYTFIFFLFAYYPINRIPDSQAPVVLSALPIKVGDEIAFGNKEYTQGTPERIIVPSAGINLQVVDGNYDKANVSWDLSKDKAQFATVTSLPNTKAGNTVIYGHNTPEVFMKLEKLNVGDVAYLYTKEGYVFEYELKSTEKVRPTDTQILQSGDDIRLSLLTCSGLFNEKRKLFTFIFKKLK
ncbi:hypothetical protein A2V54_01925 [candidate division WWE3 bacterium RBG_19FT_COMBO_53_11]|uniref:Sortase n=1 Tax=candidate division WWE3 bacterium RBG_19FT_COMBO_53_11 TaxID=1802613 RepID=A0A1F4UHT9_UNCKA|nr:MAG: hypothetical protein A2155_01215 [candidate division WWE3 bacterium RBG_16_52_45]OGC44514.1 MAG: hypothetical protein A2V54_01925 [candidate division WWE3 bacterium RBG_19FT_COMBO_53_11]